MNHLDPEPETQRGIFQLPTNLPEDMLMSSATVLSVEQGHVVLRVPTIDDIDIHVQADEDGEYCEGEGAAVTCVAPPPPLPPTKPVLPREAAQLTQKLRTMLPQLQTLMSQIDTTFDHPGE